MSTHTGSLIDIAGLDDPRTTIHRQPFPFLVTEGQLPIGAAADLDRDFPKYDSAGFFPYSPDDCGPSINAVVEAMTSPEYARALGVRLNVADMDRYPVLVTICRSLNKRHGTIHTDSRSKIATALLYLCPDWRTGSVQARRQFLPRPSAVRG